MQIQTIKVDGAVFHYIYPKTPTSVQTTIGWRVAIPSNVILWESSLQPTVYTGDAFEKLLNQLKDAGKEDIPQT